MTEKAPNPLRCDMLHVIEQVLEEAGVSPQDLPRLHAKIVDAADAYAESEKSKG